MLAATTFAAAIALITDSRPGCTVSAGKYTRNVIETAIMFCHDLTSLYRNTGFFKMLVFDILTDCNDECLARDKNLLHLSDRHLHDRP